MESCAENGKWSIVERTHTNLDNSINKLSNIDLQKTDLAGPFAELTSKMKDVNKAYHSV